jgi:hypothetical protein
MAVIRALDISLAIAVALAMVALVVFKGDALYLGLWYYITVPLVILGVCAAIRPAPLFLSGVGLAIAISMLVLMSVNWRAARPEGLLGLGHIFSLPGAIVVVVAAALRARNLQIVRPFPAFLLGFGGYGGGYFMNQLLVCNTVMWCGPMSLPIK